MQNNSKTAAEVNCNTSDKKFMFSLLSVFKKCLIPERVISMMTKASISLDRHFVFDLHYYLQYMIGRCEIILFLLDNIF